MSVLIKGMEMPTKGDYHLTLYVCGDGVAYVDVAELPADEDRFVAVPVPPHGRLGDLDELEKTFREDADAEWNRFACPANWADAFDDVADMIAVAPTIIPADKEDADVV